MPDPASVLPPSLPPNPGSQEAIESGCTCPAIDNHYGKGLPTTDGPQWIVNWQCPMHASLCLPIRRVAGDA